MQALTLLMLVAATTFEFFSKGDAWGRWAVLPSASQYVVELLGMVAAAVVIILGAQSRFRLVRADYWIVFGILIIVLVCGAVVNHLGTGPAFAGVRTYLRALPWFLIPAVYLFSYEQIQTQLKVVLGVAFVQIPLAAQQRLTTMAKGLYTGDITSGSLLISSIMSIFLICVVCLLVAMYVRGRLPLWKVALMSLALLFPTTINETKGTLFLLPIGLLLAVLTASNPGRRMRVMLMSLAMLSVFGAIFFPIYDHLNSTRPYAVPLGELLSDPERLERYLFKTEDIGTAGPAGRIDTIIVPLKRLSEDLPKLIFGLGIGNASNSALGKAFTGEYFGVFGQYLSTGIGRLLIETGLLGTALVFAILWMIFQDARIVSSRRESPLSSFAAGWAAATAVMTLAVFYKDIVMHASLSFVYWYFAGLVAAERMRLAVGMGQERSSAS